LLRQPNVIKVNKQATIPKRLQNMSTKDVATTQIEESLLKANSLSHEELIIFVKERVMAPRQDGHHNKLRISLPKILPHLQHFMRTNGKTLTSVWLSKPTETLFIASVQLCW